MPAQEENKGTFQEEEPKPVVVRKESERDLVVWTAPGRPFKRRNRDFYVTLIAIAAVFGLVLFLVEGFLPVILIISIVFLFYIMSTVEPDRVEYKITSRGIKVASKRTDWETMGRFWFTKRFGSQLLVVETAGFPGRMEVMVDPLKKSEIESKMSKHLVHEEVPPSGIDKAANWFSKKLPGN